MLSRSSTKHTTRRPREGRGEIGRGAKDERLERSDSSIPHFHITNNLPFVASLIAGDSPPSSASSTPTAHSGAPPCRSPRCSMHCLPWRRSRDSLDGPVLKSSIPWTTTRETSSSKGACTLASTEPTRGMTLFLMTLQLEVSSPGYFSSAVQTWAVRVPCLGRLA